MYHFWSIFLNHFTSVHHSNLKIHICHIITWKVNTFHVLPVINTLNITWKKLCHWLQISVTGDINSFLKILSFCDGKYHWKHRQFCKTAFKRVNHLKVSDKSLDAWHSFQQSCYNLLTENNWDLEFNDKQNSLMTWHKWHHILSFSILLYCK